MLPCRAILLSVAWGAMLTMPACAADTPVTPPPTDNPNDVPANAGTGVWTLTTIDNTTTGTNVGAFSYSGPWAVANKVGSLPGTSPGKEHGADSAGAHYTVTFTGHRIALYAAQDSSLGMASVSLDQGTATMVDFYAPNRVDNALVYLSPIVADGLHTLAVSVSGTKNAASSGLRITADRAVAWRRAPSGLAGVDSRMARLDNPVWTLRAAPLTGQVWNMDMPIYITTRYTESAVKSTARRYGGLADTFGELDSGPLASWDYAFHFGAKAGYPRIPTDRNDALVMLRTWFTGALASARDMQPTLPSVTGHYYYQHLGLRWGGDSIGSVGSMIGENIKSMSAHVAFTRGAARQYGKPWSLDISPWYGQTVLDYSTLPVWHSVDGNTLYSGKTHGHSLELMRRAYYLAYMAGATVVNLSAASVNWFNGETQDVRGNFFLSPLGKIGQEVFTTTHGFTGRGVPYTPIAVLLESTHGLGIEPQAPFYGLGPQQTPISLPSRPGDAMSRGLFDSIWPQSFSEAAWDESQYYLANSAHGDLYDVLLDDVSAAVLATYPVCIVSGTLQPDATLGALLANYVAQGGTLVVNTAQLSGALPAALTGVVSGALRPVTVRRLRWLPDGDTVATTAALTLAELAPTTAQVVWEGITPDGPVTLATTNPVGKGRIIVVAADNLQHPAVWSHLLTHLERAVMPVAIDGDIQYLVNRSATGWVVTLINNRGVTKSPTTAAVLDVAAAQTVAVTYVEPGKTLLSVHDVRANVPLTADAAGQVSVTVPPGDVTILDLSTTE